MNSEFILIFSCQVIKRKDRFIEKFMANQSLLDYFAIQ